MTTPDRSADGTRDVPGVPLPPPLIYVAGLAAGGAIEVFEPTSAPGWPITVPVVVLGAVVWLVLDGSSMLRFKRAGTPVIPFQPSTALVTDGPYRFSRNPIYLGMAALYVSLAFLLGIMWSLAILPLVIVAVDRLVIAREEPYLERKFGAEYTAFKGRVRRWI